MSLIEINKRYSELAQSECCLSCGGAINFAKAQPGETCIDLGSGRGTDALRMAEAVGKDGFVFGIDISEGMLQKANETARKLKVQNVRFLKSALEKLDLPDEIANFVISNCTINHASNKGAVWNEIFRVLKIGGRIVVSDIYASSPVPEEYKNDPSAVAECWAGAVTRDEYLKNLEEAGFSNIQVLEESAPYPKGKIFVSSWTIGALKSKNNDCCCKINNV